MTDDLCYCSIDYIGETKKLEQIIRGKIEITEIKFITNEKMILALPNGNNDDLHFLKSFIENDNIKINDVNLLI